MQRLSNWFAWSIAILTGLLAALNWHTLMMPAPIDLLIMRIDAPLGVVMLAMTAIIVAAFFVATLSNQIGSLLETRKLLKEIQRVQGLADQAESSRMEALREMIAGEFRQLKDSLEATRTASGNQPTT